MVDWCAFKGQKTTYFEGGVKSAAFVSGFGVSASSAGQRNRALIHVCDLYPSLLLHAAGANATAPAAVAAVNTEAAVAELELEALEVVDRLLLQQPPFTLGDGIQQWATIVMVSATIGTELVPSRLPMGSIILIADIITYFSIY